MAPRCGSWPGSGSVALLELVGHEQAAVGDAGAGVGQVDEAAHPGLEVVADLVEQGRQRAVARGLGHGAARGANVAQLGEVGLRGRSRPPYSSHRSGRLR